VVLSHSMDGVIYRVNVKCVYDQNKSKKHQNIV